MINAPPDSDLDGFYQHNFSIPSATTSRTNDSPSNHRSLDLDLFALSHDVLAIDRAEFPTLTATVSGQGITTATDTSTSESDLVELGSDHNEGLVDRLARMNCQIYRSVRCLANASAQSLDTATPCVTLVFENANALIGILDTCKAESLEQKKFSPVPSGLLERANKTEIFEPAIYFLVLACHQSVLSAFNAICDSMLESLKEADPSIKSTSRPSDYIDTSKLTPGVRGITMAAPVTQYVMLTALISHFLERLDRALRLLVQRLAIVEKQTGRVTDRVSDEPGSFLNNGIDDSPILRSNNETHHPDNTQGHHGSGRSEDEDLTTQIDGDGLNDSFKAAVSLVHATQTRHEQLLQHVRDVRKLVSTSDSP
ncbi:hypothetical protein F5Y08DRAFT_349222 [Xylaria arbuscula]|nr:hypothetical protein F5Y08DRAFT_349222 [Xylaria arbuscula]